MHYVTHRSHRMQKKLGEMCPDTLFVESVAIPPEHKKECVDVSRSERSRMYYVTHRSHRMQKLKFDIMCLSTFLWNSYRSPQHEK
jgi:hypothetical protein